MLVELLNVALLYIANWLAGKISVFDLFFPHIQVVVSSGLLELTLGSHIGFEHIVECDLACILGSDALIAILFYLLGLLP